MEFVNEKACYAVVEYLEEGSVAAIPYCWLTDNKRSAYWPTDFSKHQVEKSRQRCTSPEPGLWTKLKLDVRFMRDAGTVLHLVFLLMLSFKSYLWDYFEAQIH